MDTVADMLTSIINAQRVHKPRVAVPYSRFKESLARLLIDKELLAAARVQEGTRAKLVLTLKYGDADEPLISGIKRLSKPGQRVYARRGQIPYSFDGTGSVIISTPQGLMDDAQARKTGVGGELVCEVW